MSPPRITSGLAKGKILKVPNIPGIRVSQDIVKLAVFSILGEKVLASECCDLFAGSGSLGIEALSRGAKSCRFVDNNSDSLKIIEENLLNCGLYDNADIVFSDVSKFVRKVKEKFDIVFMDPFFDDTSQRFVFRNLINLLKDSGVVVYTHAVDLDIATLIADMKFAVHTQKKFGRMALTVLKVICT